MSATITTDEHIAPRPSFISRRAFWFFGVLVALLFVTEVVFILVAFKLPDDRLPEARATTARDDSGDRGAP